MSKTRPALRLDALPDSSTLVTVSAWLGRSSDPGHAQAELSIPYLFDASSEPVLIVDSLSIRIIEVNRAAAAALRTQREQLLGLTLMQLFDEASRALLRPALRQARVAGGATVSCRMTGTDASPVIVTVSEVSVAPQVPALLVRLRPAAAEPAPARSAVMQSIENAALAFVVTDLKWRVQYANAAFAGMLGLTSVPLPPQASLTKWLQLSPEHHRSLHQQMGERRAVTEFNARLRSESGRVCQVEVCAVAVPPAADGRGGVQPCWAVTLREIQSPVTIN